VSFRKNLKKEIEMTREEIYKILNLHLKMTREEITIILKKDGWKVVKEFRP